ncbi:MAG: class I SAM-dependent RNA methyltransferase [Oligoflexales bacterium]|nr:class I SAM-dependent RNA methyltransferase [Oligoflexales bacterium]
MKKKTKKNQPNLILKMTGMAFGGRAVARKEGKVYFVENAIEGDEAEISIVKDKPQYSEATVAKIIKESPHRIKSPCIYSDMCGGCPWISADYEKQKEWKEGFVKDSILRIGGIEDFPQIKFYPPDLRFNYRNRIQLRLEGGAVPNLGYFSRSTRSLVPITGCKVAHDSINDMIARIVNEGSIKIRGRIKAEFIVIHDGRLIITLTREDRPSKSDTAILKEYFDKDKMVALCCTPEDENSSRFLLLEKDLGIEYYTGALQFQQINSGQNQLLRRLCLNWISRLNPSTVLDLYCGSGNLSLPLSKAGREIIGVEGNSKSVECARFNIEKNSLEGFTFISENVSEYLDTDHGHSGRRTAVICDPPRSGMGECIEPLIKMLPDSILYVSCDPVTLSRDLARLYKGGYEIIDLNVLDFFPHTYHVETFAVLSRK